MLAVAVAIDLVLGEPPRAIHPVVWLGKLTSLLQRGAKDHSALAQLACGVGITLLLVGLFVTASYFLLFYLKEVSFAAYVISGAVLLKSAFSLKELRRVALNVKGLLLSGELDKVRTELRSLVSRDTRGLSQPLLVSATVESVAENTCDSFVAPLFYYLLLGVPGAIAYRVVNTLDAMIGYHGEYEYLGKFASKLDDVLNFVPARITALLFVLASFLSRRDARASWQVACNDHAKTASPNAGWTMASVAGALNIQLEKAGYYKLGKTNAPPVPETIDAALHLMLIAASAWMVICFMAGVVHCVFTT
mgnify:CR=1 FL=1